MPVCTRRALSDTAPAKLVLVLVYAQAVRVAVTRVTGLGLPHRVRAVGLHWQVIRQVIRQVARACCWSLRGHDLRVARTAEVGSL